MTTILEGIWKMLFIGGHRDGESYPFPSESSPGSVAHDADIGLEHDYRCLGYVARGGANVLIFACGTTTIADLDCHGLVDDLFIKKHQPFQLVP